MAEEQPTAAPQRAWIDGFGTFVRNPEKLRPAVAQLLAAFDAGVDDAALVYLLSRTQQLRAAFGDSSASTLFNLARRSLVAAESNAHERSALSQRYEAAAILLLGLHAAGREAAAAGAVADQVTP